MVWVTSWTFLQFRILYFNFYVNQCSFGCQKYLPQSQRKGNISCVFTKNKTIIILGFREVQSMYSAGQCLKQFASTDIARDLAAAVPAVVERKGSAAAVGHFLWPLLCCLASDVVQLLYWSMSGSSGASTSRSVEALSSFSPWPRTLLKTPSPPPPHPHTHTTPNYPLSCCIDWYWVRYR